MDAQIHLWMRLVRDWLQNCLWSTGLVRDLAVGEATRHNRGPEVRGLRHVNLHVHDSVRRYARLAIDAHANLSKVRGLIRACQGRTWKAWKNMAGAQ